MAGIRQPLNTQTGYWALIRRFWVVVGRRLTAMVWTGWPVSGSVMVAVKVPVVCAPAVLRANSAITGPYPASSAEELSRRARVVRSSA